MQNIMVDVLEKFSDFLFRSLLYCLILILLGACDPYVPDLYGAIEGVVISSETGEYLPNSEVILIENNASLLTNKDGFYKFDGLREGNYVVKVRKIGYYEDRKNIKVVCGVSSTLSFSLIPIN